jgi:hypothetical protein
MLVISDIELVSFPSLNLLASLPRKPGPKTDALEHPRKAACIVYLVNY